MLSVLRSLFGLSPHNVRFSTTNFPLGPYPYFVLGRSTLSGLSKEHSGVLADSACSTYPFRGGFALVSPRPHPLRGGFALDTRPFFALSKEHSGVLADSACSTYRLATASSTPDHFLLYRKKWSGRQDLNLRRLAPKASALAELSHAPKI